MWISVFPFLLFNPIHTIRHLRGSGIWENCYGMVHPGPESRSESKRMTRYAMEHPGEKPLEGTKSSLTFPSGRRKATPTLSSHLVLGRKALFQQAMIIYSALLMLVA